MERERVGQPTGIKKLWNKYSNYGSLDTGFLVAVLVLLAIGLVTLFSASYPYAMTHNDSGLFYIKRQVLFSAIGLVAMFVVSRINIELLQKLAVIIAGVSFFLVVIALILPGDSNGFHRWINLGQLSFQPSEITKFAVIVLGAFLYSKYYKKMSSKKPAKTPVFGAINRKLNMGLIRESWVPTWIFCGFFGISAVLVYAGNHLSGCLLILALGVIMMYLGGVRQRWFAVLFIVAGVAVVLVAVYIITNYDPTDSDAQSNLLKRYMGERIYAWWNKDYSPRGARWQTNQALYAIGSGGFFGKGLGNSTQKYMYVSEPQNDMIFSIACEEYGFIGAAIIILFFVFLIYRGIVIGLGAKNRFCGLVTMGIVFQVGIQVLLNIAVATDFIPNTGISLPFFSYGGTFMVMLLAEMGVVLSVSRTAKIKKK